MNSFEDHIQDQIPHGELLVRIVDGKVEATFECNMDGMNQITSWLSEKLGPFIEKTLGDCLTERFLDAMTEKGGAAAENSKQLRLLFMANTSAKTQHSTMLMSMFKAVTAKKELENMMPGVEGSLGKMFEGLNRGEEKPDDDN